MSAFSLKVIFVSSAEVMGLGGREPTGALALSMIGSGGGHFSSGGSQSIGQSKVDKSDVGNTNRLWRKLVQKNKNVADIWSEGK